MMTKNGWSMARKPRQSKLRHRPHLRPPGAGQCRSRSWPTCWVSARSRPYVVRLESGEANPSIAKAGRIFAALWLTPIDKPFPLLKGYGPYEPPREYASGQEAAPSASEESGRKVER